MSPSELRSALIGNTVPFVKKLPERVKPSMRVAAEVVNPRNELSVMPRMESQAGCPAAIAPQFVEVELSVI